MPAILFGEKNIIGKIIDIIIENSINATKDGCILINVEPTKKDDDNFFIRFDIIDTGNGVSDDYKPKVFEIFELADKSTTRKQQGLGIGLALSKKFCDLLGGEIGYESSPQHGTAFWCIIPCKLLQENNTYDIPTKKIELQTSKNITPTSKRILVAEDDETLQLVIGAQLDKLQKQHTIFPNGKPLIAEYIKHHQEISMVLLDWNMPVCNASEAIAAIRQHEMTLKLTPVTIAVLSAHDKHNAQEMKLPSNITLLQKPVTTEDLIQLLSSTGHL